MARPSHITKLTISSCPLLLFVAMLATTGSWSGLWAGVVVGHRGTGSAPENTLAAITQGLDDGVPIVEVDVRTTADGHHVVIHDETVERTTNGTGLVSEMTLAQVRALDAGSWKGSEYTGERVPTVREVMQLIRDRQAHLILDIKFADPEVLHSIATEEGLADSRLGFLLWHGSLWRPYVSRFPDAEVIVIDHPGYGISYAEMRRDHGISGIGLWSSVVTADKLEAIRDAGLHAHTYTVNADSEAERLHGMGVNYIWTDQTGTLPRHRFDQWRTEMFRNPFHVADPLAAFDSDPDADNRPNGVEYLEGTHPLTPDRGSLEVTSGTTTTRVTYRHLHLRSDVIPMLQGSSDLRSWQNLTVQQTAGALQTVSVLTIDSDTSLQFFRLGATRNEAMTIK